MSALARDLTQLKHQRNLVHEFAARIERDGQPGVADCVRIQADEIYGRIRLRLQELARMRRDFAQVTQAATERIG